MKKIDLYVEKIPTYVVWTCPHCEWENRIEYDKVETILGEPCDWNYSELECEECHKICEVDSVDWD